MRLTYLRFLLFFVLTIWVNVFSAPFDTGFITFFQPDETEFTGRMWGDEFINWAETEEGYRFVLAENSWYYYATLDENGEFAPSEYKVGIDEPPSESYHLERSQQRLDEIAVSVEQFNEQVLVDREWFQQKQEEARQLNQPASISVAVILIEFPDTAHYQDPGSSRPDGYYSSDFDNMVYSENYWIDTSGILGIHPESERIFGSFRDYWDQISKGSLIITGEVVNNENDGVPTWLMAQNGKTHYYGLGGLWELSDEAYHTAIDSGLITPGEFDKYFIIYAGEATLIYACGGGRYFIDAERSGHKGNGGPKSFTHIGVPAHEFGHTIGMQDEYIGMGEDGKTDLYNFDLMAWGEHNGPNQKGACPSTLSPYYRILFNWADPIVINSIKHNFRYDYKADDPLLYKITPINGAQDEHYIFESRGREGFDLYVPSNPTDTINQPGRLLIWQHNTSSNIHGTYHDRIRIKHADNDTSEGTQLNDFFPANFALNNYQNFNDTTHPCASVREASSYWNDPPIPGYFWINGIQKVTNNNTVIEEVVPKTIDTLIVQSGWQTVSVPVIMSDSSALAVLGTIEVYKFDSSFVQVFQLDNGLGYWAKFSSGPHTIIFNGLPVDSLALPVRLGWNLKGSLFYEFPVAQIYADPDTIIESIFRFQNQYIRLSPNDTIKPGIGYWIKTKGAGTVYMEPNLAKITTVPEVDLSIMDKFTINDTEGNKQVLYVTNTDIDSNSFSVNFEMPPYYSELPFDSRFEMSDLVKKVSAQAGPIDLNILVHTLSYPVTISWELNPTNGINYTFIGDSILGKVSQILTSSGSEAISSLPSGKIKLIAFATGDYSSVIPKEFNLLQNYPNPFNPITRIKYSIAKETNVNLSVYNILGETVAELKNDVMKPGYYEVNFKAESLPSGVYLYTLQTTEYSSTKKMILIK